MAEDELFPVVTPEGDVVGSATRRQCHSGAMLLHPVVHLHIFSADGCVLLQRRSMNKDIQPGRWDTSVGGHVDFGEEVEAALRREVREELGLVNFIPEKLTSYVFQSSVERELVNTYFTVLSDLSGLRFDPDEIDEIRFWPVVEIEQALGHDVFTPNFEQEFVSIVRPLLATRSMF